MKHIINIFTICIVAMLSWACSDDEPAVSQDEFRYDIVTYNGFSDGVASFIYIPRNDGPQISYYGNIGYKPEIKNGARVLLNYYLKANSQNSTDATEIKISYISTINNDTIRGINHNRVDTLTREDIRLKSIWRTGNYLNINGELEYTGEKRYFYLAMDKSTVDSDTIHAYLVNNTVGKQKYHWRQFVASFYVGNVWCKQSCSTLCVHINNSIFPDTKEYYFSK